MAERFNWLHLTDLHWGHRDLDGVWFDIEELFFEDLEKRLKHQPFLFPIHAVFSLAISGIAGV